MNFITRDREMNMQSIDNINLYWKQIFHYLKKTSNPILNDLNLTKVDANILLILHHQGAQTKAKLAELLSFQPNSLTRSIERLVSEKWITRITDKNDRRFIQLSITTEGKRIIENYISQTRETWKALLSGLSDDEIIQLEATLKNIRKRAL